MEQYGLEALSRGAEKAILCDKSKEAIQIIKTNVEKTHFQEKTEIYNTDFEKCLSNIKEEVDIIYIDPPYETINQIEKLKFEIIDKRKYGIAHIIFLKKE